MLQRCAQSVHRHTSRRIRGHTVGAGAQSGDGQGARAELSRQRVRRPVGVVQRDELAVAPAPPWDGDRVHDPARRQPEAWREGSPALFEAADRPGRLGQPRPAAAMHRPVHARVAEHLTVRGVDQDVDRLIGDIAAPHLDRHRPGSTRQGSRGHHGRSGGRRLAPARRPAGSPGARSRACFGLPVDSRERHLLLIEAAFHAELRQALLVRRPDQGVPGELLRVPRRVGRLVVPGELAEAVELLGLRRLALPVG